MNRNILYLIISLFAVLVLILTNPKDEEHKAAVKAKMSQLMQKAIIDESAKSKSSAEQAGLGLGALLGGYMVDKLIEGSVTRSNFLLFSTTNFTFGDETKTIGLGVLGNVFLSSKIDEKLKEVRTGK